MFLIDLYRYRKRSKRESKEDFLTSCLAEAMRRDDGVVDGLLHAFKREELIVPSKARSATGNYRVRTQVRRSLSGEHQTRRNRSSHLLFDLVVETRARKVWVIEAKVDAPPDLDQLRDYEDAWPNAAVSLLCPNHSLPHDHEDKKSQWFGFRPTTWQTVSRALTAHIASLKRQRDGALKAYLSAFLELLRHLNLMHHDFPASEAFKRNLKHRMRLAALDGAIRNTVERLTSAHIALPAPTDEHEDLRKSAIRWVQPHQGECGWLRQSARDGSELLGLGLRMEAREGVGDDLAMELLLRPSKALNRRLTQAHKQGDTAWLRRMYPWLEEDGWWKWHLSEPGSPGLSVAQTLRLAIKEARQVLKYEVPWGTSSTNLGPRVVGNGRYKRLFTDLDYDSKEVHDMLEETRAFEQQIYWFLSHVPYIVSQHGEMSESYSIDKHNSSRRSGSVKLKTLKRMDSTSKGQTKTITLKPVIVHDGDGFMGWSVATQPRRILAQLDLSQHPNIIHDASNEDRHRVGTRMRNCEQEDYLNLLGAILALLRA